MYIEPNTIIRLLQDVRLDNTYENTIYFDSVSAQRDYFIGKTKHTLVNNTYQRVNKGSMKVKLSADKCYNCNYMMFQNSAYGNKWFYAFITRVEYVNNGVTQIDFELDEMQTWFFETTLLESFVEREHSTSDYVGGNILPESVELGEYYYSDKKPITNALSPMAVVIGVVDTEGTTSVGNIYDNVYSGVKYYAFNSDDTSTISNFLRNYVLTPDNVVAMYMCPVIVATESVIADGTITEMASSTNGWSAELSLSALEEETIVGYNPKNKKLYTYPYYFIHIDNNNGESLDLRYEFFNGAPKVQLHSCSTMPVKITCRPKNYKGISEQLDTEVITLENYPMCSWNMDSYKVWLSQNVRPMVNKLSSSVVTSVIGGGFGSVVGGLTSVDTFKNVKQMGIDRYKASIEADMCKGNINSGNVNVSHEMQNFYYSICHINVQYCKAIDNYFTLFGYTTRELKVPNRNSRPYWNYVKTIGCNLVANAPADSVRKIKSIYDNGVRFWKNGDNIGNYSLDNSV